MADSFQGGRITTLHNIVDRPLEEIEAELVTFAEDSPMGLILPSLFSELQGPALSKIIDELVSVPYLEQIVIGLDRADEAEYRHALEFFSRLPQPHRVLWNDGPNLLAIDKMLREHNLAPTQMGKGRNVWYCMGYMLACDAVQAVALHDCDIDRKSVV